MKLIGSGESPRERPCRMRAKSGGVTFIAHVPDEEVLSGVLEVEIGLERTELHHARSETVADQDNARIFF